MSHEIENIMENFITLNRDNIGSEHICCAFSDKKCARGYELKKEWLRGEFDRGYVFHRLDARAKVFLEWGPAENSWTPIDAPNYLVMGCFWVSGQCKGKGYAKSLLQAAIDDARAQGRDGLVAVVGTKKYHFMSDTKWLVSQGFVECQKIAGGFSLLVLKLNPKAADPKFRESVLSGGCSKSEDVVVYYSNRCPFTEYYVQEELKQATEKRGLSLAVVKLETAEEARNTPSPATIFSLYYKGRFVTTDVSACMDSRFDKAVLGK